MTFTEKYEKATVETLVMLRQEKARLQKLMNTYRKAMNRAAKDEEAEFLHDRLAIYHLRLDLIDNLIAETIKGL